MVISVDGMAMDLHVQDGPSVKFPADAAFSGRKRAPDAIFCQAVVLQAPSDHKRHENVGRSAEHFEEVRVEIDQGPAADPGNLAKDALRAFRDRPPFFPGQRVDQIGHRRRTAVLSVGNVKPCKLSCRKAVFISLPACARAPWL